MSDQDLCISPPQPPPPPAGFMKNAPAGVSSSDELVNHFSRVTEQNHMRAASPHTVVRQLISNLLPSERANGGDDSEGDATVCLSFFIYIHPVIQVGPSCGLAALAMAGQLLTGFDLQLSQIMNAATELDYTRYGEMFSADNLLSLALQLLPTCTGRLLLPNVTRRSKIEQIVDSLMHHGAVLVPYDRDANSEPCLKQGHRAHWALLTGVLLTVENCNVLESEHVTYETDPIVPWLIHAKADQRFHSRALNLAEEHAYVFAVHGRSTRTCVWSLREVLNSNEQLIEMDPRKHASLDGELPGDFCIPPGGVKEGLCGKIIVVSRHQSDESK